MANYSAPLLYNAVTTLFKTAGVLFTPASSSRRFMIYEYEFGQAGTYANTDISCLWDVSRITTTAAMTGSAVIANLYDPGDTASVTLFMNANTAEPTYTTAGNGLSIKSWGINQRGSYRWRALDDGDNIIVPIGTVNGVGIRTLSPSSGFANSAVGSVSFVER